MRNLKPWSLSLFLSLLPACGQQLVEFPNPTPASADTRTPDRADGTSVGGDPGMPDVPITDAAGVEATPPDAPNRDAAAALLDAAVLDSAELDGSRIEHDR